VNAHPLPLPGDGFYLASMPQSASARHRGLLDVDEGHQLKSGGLRRARATSSAPTRSGCSSSSRPLPFRECQSTTNARCPIRNPTLLPRVLSARHIYQSTVASEISVRCFGCTTLPTSEREWQVCCDFAVTWVTEGPVSVIWKQGLLDTIPAPWLCALKAAFGRLLSCEPVSTHGSSPRARFAGKRSGELPANTVSAV